MKCVVCGKKLSGNKRKYCCGKCAQVGYNTGKSQPKINTEYQVRELWGYFQRAFDFNGQRFIPSQVWKARVFICACYELGYTPNSISRGIKKDHSTVLYHHRRASDEEKMLASDFLKDSKKYRYINKIKDIQSIYPQGFHY